MKKNLSLLVVAFAAALSANAQGVSNDNEDAVYKIDQRAQRSHDFVAGQVLVKFKDESPVKVTRAKGKFMAASVNAVDAVMKEFGVEEMEQLLPNENPKRPLRKARAYNGQLIEERDLSQLYSVKLKSERSDSTLLLIDKLKELKEVEFAEPNYKVYALDDVDISANFGGNPYVQSQWYLDDYGVKQLWTKPVINKKRPVIAIIDTGVDMTYPDLVDNLWTNKGEEQGEDGYDNDGNGFKNDLHGWDFINNTGRIRDNNKHGTHVAGIAAASDNKVGIVGTNPKAYIMPVTVMQSDGVGDISVLIKGIDYAIANGATVLNFSLGTYANSSALRQALEKAYQSAVLVASSGNDAKCIYVSHYPSPCMFVGPMFPAAYSFVLGVQATTQQGALASFSNYDDDGNTYSCESTLKDPDGFNYELKAPGVNMLSCIPGGKYDVMNGTSMAAPLVAGAISALQMVKQYDTQEILWGDLLHTDNIIQAYNVTKRPAELDLIKVMFRERKELADETEEDYSGDGRIDAGETVSLYPVIRTTFGEASNIKMHLEMGDEFEDASTVEILTGEVDFGLHLDAYGKGVSLNPLKLKVADNVADGRHIKMKFVATCDESSTIYEGHFTMTVDNMVKISGLISEDKTLTADHVYYVNENLGIMEGATLTIEPGTRLEFAEGMGLSSFGKLVANGTPEKPIVFTRHTGEGAWAGIKSHESTGEHRHNGGHLYTNSDSTSFTMIQTETTPNKMGDDYAWSTVLSTSIYYGDTEDDPSRSFLLSDYIDYGNDMNAKQNLLTDPDYLTPYVLQMLKDYKDYCAKYADYQYSDERKHSAGIFVYFDSNWSTYDNPRDTISYCRIEDCSVSSDGIHPYLEDCILSPTHISLSNYYDRISGVRNNVVNSPAFYFTHYNTAKYTPLNFQYTNFINNDNRYSTTPPHYSDLINNNFFNNIFDNDKKYLVGSISSTPTITHTDDPSYYGTSRENILRPYIYEIGNASGTWGRVDLSNMRTEPIHEAHGIVWKVVVNGKDAQDEYEDLAPLGVGKHKFEVYFNRPMNKVVAPNISFGVRDPWTQNGVSEDGSWNEEGTIYTAYKTITGKTKSDGVNRIYVYGAEDDEYFEIPYEKTRFNIQVQAAGSMATGFAAEAGLGKVDLTWHNEENDFEDAMGFNVYRYGEPYQKILPSGWRDGNWYSQPDTIMVADTLRINDEILDIDATSFTDYDVVPGSTYYYYYKVLSTDLQEFDISNVVAATPLTSKKGDANGDTEVDVADVITTVNYAAGMEPKPFIYEAADMNSDQQIDILDVIGIIKNILNPTATAAAMAEATATYTVENGVLYVESTVALAGVQVQLAVEKDATLTVADDLKGFEQASAWLTDEDYLLLAYSMNGETLSAGKHALLYIGDADLVSMRLSDASGRSVKLESGEATGIASMGRSVKNVKGVYNMMGQKVAGSEQQLKPLPKGVYIIDGVKVIR